MKTQNKRIEFQYRECLLEVIRKAPKGSVVLYDESSGKIIVNPSKYDLLMTYSRKRK